MAEWRCGCQGAGGRREFAGAETLVPDVPSLSDVADRRRPALHPQSHRLACSPTVGAIALAAASAGAASR